MEIELDWDRFAWEEENFHPISAGSQGPNPIPSRSARIKDIDSPKIQQIIVNKFRGKEAINIILDQSPFNTPINNNTRCYFSVFQV